MKHELSDIELDRYSRQVVLKDIGYRGQLKLRNGKACIVGLGGLGAPTALKLVAMGIGYLRIIDRDIVSRSDLHRQYLYDVDSIGQPKVEVALQKLSRLNPDIEIDPVPASLNLNNAKEVLSNVDVVIDGLDRPVPRYIVNRTCNRLGTPYVFGAAIEAFGNVSTIVPGRTACLECFMPGLKDDDLPKCGVVGVHPSVLGIVSSIQVSEATKLLIGQEPKLLNKLLYIDIRNMSFDVINVHPSEKCAIFQSKGSPTPIKEKLFEETCARDGRRNFIISPKEKIEVNLEELRRVLDQNKIQIRTMGALGITFEYSKGISISILKSGVVIAQTSPRLKVNPKEKVIKIYKWLLIDKLGIPQATLPGKT